MSFVLDASIAISRAFADEEQGAATVALSQVQQSSARVPGLWWFEVRNTLVMNERRGRLTEGATSAFLRNLGKLAITFDRTPDETRTLTFARQHRLTVYDAAYLELAQREGVPLATLDKALIAAAAQAGVPLL